MIDYTKTFYNINLKCIACNKEVDISSSRSDIIFIDRKDSPVMLIHGSCYYKDGIIRKPGKAKPNALKNFKPKLKLKGMTERKLSELLEE